MRGHGLPSRLWIIGLGNLGKRVCWILAALPYADPRAVQLVLQDLGRISESNRSMSLLAFGGGIPLRKARIREQAGPRQYVQLRIARQLSARDDSSGMEKMVPLWRGHFKLRPNYRLNCDRFTALSEPGPTG